MANWENVMVDTDQMEPGKFYKLYTDKDNVTLLISKDSEDIIHQMVQDHKLKVIELQQTNSQILSKVVDNQSRINNLEDRDLKKSFIEGMEISSIKKEFVNSTYIEVDYGRKEIHNVTVFKRITDDDNERIYEEMTAGVEIRYHEKYNNGVLFEKQVIIETNQPVSGYVLVL